MKQIWDIREEVDAETSEPIPVPEPVILPVVDGKVAGLPPDLVDAMSPSGSPASAASSPEHGSTEGKLSTPSRHSHAPQAATPGLARRGSHGEAEAPGSYPTHCFFSGHFTHSIPAAAGAASTTVVEQNIPESLYLHIKPPKRRSASPSSSPASKVGATPGSSLDVRGAGQNQFGTFTVKGSLDVSSGKVTLKKVYGPAKARTRPRRKRTTPLSNLATDFTFHSGSDGMETSPTDSAGRRASGRRRQASWRLSGKDFIEPSALEVEKAKQQEAARLAAVAKKKAATSAARRGGAKRHREDGMPVTGEGMHPPKPKKALGEGGVRLHLRVPGSGSGSRAGGHYLERPADNPAAEAAAAAMALASAFSHDSLASQGTVYVAPHRLALEAGPLAGDLYEGEMKGGVPDGTGTVIYRSGYMYEGEFSRGVESGWGVLSDPTDITVYEGEVQDGAITGYGTFKFETGAMYTGQWREGLFHGCGAYTQPDGSKFEGQWDEGLLSGHGTAVYADGSTYEGGWSHGEKHGKGTLVRADGYTYVGSWACDVPDGKGEATYPDGSRYQGTLKAGKREGRGVYYFPKGIASLTGRWREDQLEESGKGGLDIKHPLQVSPDEWIIPLMLATSDVKRIHQRAGFNEGGE